MKKLLLSLAAGLLLALGWNILFNLYLSPDFRFWNRCAAASEQWETQLRRESAAPCYVFGGGSETRTSVDPQQLAEDYGLRAVNAAGQGFYGGVCNAAYGLHRLHAGDTYIFPLSAYDLNEAPRDGGMRFLWKRCGSEVFGEGLIPCSWATLRAPFSGDAMALSGSLLKSLFTREPVCRYDRDARIRPSGWAEVLTHEQAQYRPARTAQPERLNGLSEADIAAFRKLADCCRAKGASLLLTVHLAHREREGRAAQAMMALSAVRAGFRVLKDERLGCEPNGRLFADTDNHQSAEGVRLSMRIIGRALSTGSCWTEEELVRELRYEGRNPDGTLRSRSLFGPGR